VRRFGHPSYVRFENNARDDVGTSAIGRTGGGQSIHIGKSLSSGGVAHEIGHAIGLAHEHSSPERDRYVNVLLSNVEPGQEFNFDVATDFLVLRPYDYVSIMHYGATSFGKKDAMGNRLTTMSRKDGDPTLGRGNELTFDDVAGVEELYGPFAFVSGFGSGWAPGNKQCFAMGPSKDTRFQTKTGTTLFCVASPPKSWLWSNVGLSDPRISGLPPGSYQCHEIYYPADADYSAEKSYLCHPAGAPLILRWSDKGTLFGLKCVQPYIQGVGQHDLARPGDRRLPGAAGRLRHLPGHRVRHPETGRSRPRAALQLLEALAAMDHHQGRAAPERRAGRSLPVCQTGDRHRGHVHGGRRDEVDPAPREDDAHPPVRRPDPGGSVRRSPGVRHRRGQLWHRVPLRPSVPGASPGSLSARRLPAPAAARRLPASKPALL
jgi:hypothetical protein